MIVGGYNLFMTLAQRLCPLIAAFTGRQKKVHRLAVAQQHVLADIEQTMATRVSKVDVCWFHAASLGEYNVIRPIIERLKATTSCTVVLTFFSPTGVEALTGEGKSLPSFVDYVFYLPIDTRRNVRRFLDAVRPKKAVFAVSEYWVNYLQALYRRQIPAYLVSAKITERSALLRWYGRLFYREALKAYRTMMVLDEPSKRRLEQVAVGKVVVMGDPLFDAAASVAQTPYHDAIVEGFCSGRQVFVAGSIHMDADLQLVATVANRHPDMKCLFVPHEVSAAAIAQVKRAVEGRAVAYSECRSAADAQAAQVLIIDFVGALARLYRFGTWAYVGGGFTPYLHSLIEATVYGLPVSFGPCTERVSMAGRVMQAGIGCKVSTADELDSWLTELRNNNEKYETIRQQALDFARRNVGATASVVNMIAYENKG